MALVLLSAVIALVNGTLEEVFWRGAYVRAFPGIPLLAWVYPSVGFGLWHLAPQSVSTGIGNPSGVVAFVGTATLFGLCWAWVAYRTGPIRWPVISHMLLDFAGLGARVYLIQTPHLDRSRPSPRGHEELGDDPADDDPEKGGTHEETHHRGCTEEGADRSRRPTRCSLRGGLRVHPGIRPRIRPERKGGIGGNCRY
ncbi:MAG: CPBP family intramembrane metalloprotease [Gemmatimonadales bacterium]|nr:MAG: CPBP family intramembrane metalloprotease [Gemmatimonadales bacterium]